MRIFIKYHLNIFNSIKTIPCAYSLLFFCNAFPKNWLTTSASFFGLALLTKAYQLNFYTMDHNSIEVLLVEDNTDDAELTIRELKKNHLANNLFHVRDGEEAIDFIFAKGKYEGITGYQVSAKDYSAGHPNAENKRD